MEILRIDGGGVIVLWSHSRSLHFVEDYGGRTHEWGLGEIGRAVTRKHESHFSSPILLGLR